MINNRTINYDDGTIGIWKYDLSKSKNGPYEVEIIYPKGYKHQDEIIIKEQSNLPLTKRMFLNPINGKMVGYFRAKNLGLITPIDEK